MWQHTNNTTRVVGGEALGGDEVIVKEWHCSVS